MFLEFKTVFFICCLPLLTVMGGYLFILDLSAYFSQREVISEFLCPILCDYFVSFAGRQVMLTFRHFSKCVKIVLRKHYKKFVKYSPMLLSLCCDIVAVLLGLQSCLSHQRVWTCV